MDDSGQWVCTRPSRERIARRMATSIRHRWWAIQRIPTDLNAAVRLHARRLFSHQDKPGCNEPMVNVNDRVRNFIWKVREPQADAVPRYPLVWRTSGTA